jgi:hypothetical protein
MRWLTVARFLPHCSRLEPMHFPVECIGLALLYQAERPGYEDDHLLYLVTKLWMHGAMPQLSHTYSWHCNELSTATHVPFQHYRCTVAKLMAIIRERVKKYTGNT